MSSRRQSDSLRRMLVMLPWLMERGEVSLTEMGQRFRISEAELVSDLELIATCGLPPFVDELIDVFIDDGMVYAGIPRFFTKPLRLSSPEGFALLSAGRSAMSMPGADPASPLGRALDKLAAALGDVDLAVEVAHAEAGGAVSAALAAGERLHITYFSAGRDAISERTITPLGTFVDRGIQYVLADDDQSGTERIFRVDRISSWERAGTAVNRREVVLPSPGTWFSDPDLPTVTLRLEPAASWVAERFPVVDRRPDGEAVLVTLAVVNDRWLDALLLRLGPMATIVAPAERADQAVRAAQEMLARYEAIGS